MRLTQRLCLVIAVAVAPMVAVKSHNAYSLIEQERSESHKLALDYGPTRAPSPTADGACASNARGIARVELSGSNYCFDDFTWQERW